MTTQEFLVVREPAIKAYHSESYTPGQIYIDNRRFAYTLEDEDRFLENGVTEKIHGKTAIPRGRYRAITSLSNRFGVVLPLLLDVPNFSGIRLHGANDAGNVEGCIGIGQIRTSSGIAHCPDVVKRIVSVIRDAESKNVPSWITVK